MSSTRMTHTLISAFTDAEPWKVDHDHAMICRDLEDSMEWCVRLMRAIDDDEAELPSLSPAMPIPEYEEALARIDRLRRSLADTGRRLLESVTILKARGQEVDGVEDFRLEVEKAQCQVDAAAFERELPSHEEMLPLLSPDNPRPERYGVTSGTTDEPTPRPRAHLLGDRPGQPW